MIVCCFLVQWNTHFQVSFSFVRGEQSDALFFFYPTNKCCYNAIDAVHADIKQQDVSWQSLAALLVFPALLSQPDMCSAWWYNYQTKMPQPLLRSLFHQLADRRSGDNLFGAASTMKRFRSPPRFPRSLPSRLVSHFGFTLIFTASQTISCFTFPLRIISGAKQATLSVSGCATASGINRVSLKPRKQPEMSCKARERTGLKLTIELLLAPFSSAFLMQPVIRKRPLWKMSVRVWVYLHRDNTQKQVD